MKNSVYTSNQSTQKFSFIKKKSVPGSPRGKDNYHSRKSSMNMDQSLLEMNERIKAQNQQYLKGLNKNTHALTIKRNQSSPLKKEISMRSYERTQGTNKKSFNRYLDASSDSDE